MIILMACVRSPRQGRLVRVCKASSLPSACHAGKRRSLAKISHAAWSHSLCDRSKSIIFSISFDDPNLKNGHNYESSFAAYLEETRNRN